MQPKCLVLALQLGDPHWFVGVPSCEKIKQISRNVETLRLRHRTFSIKSNSDLLSGSDVRVPITAANFPELRHLILDRLCGASLTCLTQYSELAPLEMSALPPLTHLTPIGYN